MLKNEKSANSNDHQNRKTEVLCNKNRKTDLKNSLNRKTENPNAPLLTALKNFQVSKALVRGSCWEKTVKRSHSQIWDLKFAYA